MFIGSSPEPPPSSSCMRDLRDSCRTFAAYSPWRAEGLCCKRGTMSGMASRLCEPLARWTIEESFQAGKGLAGLDEHQVRRWTSWRRWTLFAMLAPNVVPAPPLGN